MKRTINFKVTRLALAGCALLLSHLAWADTAPKLATEVVLPSPAVAEVTTMHRHG